jgi:tRNA (guanine6-N2)-methyltransferase
LKNKYFATFISGFHEPIEILLKSSISDCCINILLDGAVVFETDYSYDRLGMHCFNNIFALIDIMKTKGKGSCIEEHMQDILRRKLLNEIISSNTKKIKTFRVIASSENQLVAINENVKNAFEMFIAQQSKLLLNRSKSDAEFWILYRNEGFCFFMKRLSKHTAYDKLLNKGELHPELAFLLNQIAAPVKSDICLDPFCGYGSIPLQRLKHFPTEKFYAFDNNEKVLAVAKDKLKNHLNSRCIVKNVNFNLIENSIAFESIDKIVTDPPWGLFENIKDIAEFYRLIIDKCIRLIKLTGKIVIMTAKKEELLKAVESTSNCSITKTYSILVSGKKASVFVIERIGKIC